jgi:hypothetical protein
MVIKGLAYTKTPWAFAERPVASAKLNTWDDRIEAALELAFRLLGQAWGGCDGVVRGAGSDDLAVQSTPTPSLSVEVQPGYALIGGLPFKIAVPTETVDVAAPITNPRIDLVQASLETWNVLVKPGVEAATPSAPAADADCIALAELYLRPGMASIKNADDGTHGYITDVRAFV